MINDWEITCEENRKLAKNAGKLSGGRRRNEMELAKHENADSVLKSSAWKAEKLTDEGQQITINTHFRPLAKENRTHCCGLFRP